MFKSLRKTLRFKKNVLRDLRSIRDAVLGMRADLRRLSTAHLIELMEFSLANDPRYADPKRMIRHAHQTFSQNGEDGIIAEICRRIEAPSRNFLEIGVGNGLENNTTYLLSQGWRGWWLEGNIKSVSEIRSRFRRQIVEGALTIVGSLVTAENVGSLLEQAQVPHQFDLLSIDIDRNTYWIWSAMRAYKPRLVVIEYNSSFPADVDWKVEYLADKQWDRTIYFGASLKALELLGRELGYSLVGCEFMGVNAFFVRDDLCADKFCAPFTAENHYEPPRYGLIGRLGHRAGFGDLT